MCLYVQTGLVVLQLGPPGLAVFLELTRFWDEDVCNENDLSFVDGIAYRYCIIGVVVEPCIEASDWIVGL